MLPHSYHNSALLAMCFMKFEHLFKRVVANDITVQHKEGFRVDLQALPSQRQWTSYMYTDKKNTTDKQLSPITEDDKTRTTSLW